MFLLNKIILSYRCTVHRTFLSGFWHDATPIDDSLAYTTFPVHSCKVDSDIYDLSMK